MTGAETLRHTDLCKLLLKLGRGGWINSDCPKQGGELAEEGPKNRGGRRRSRRTWRMDGKDAEICTGMQSGMCGILMLVKVT